MDVLLPIFAFDIHTNRTFLDTLKIIFFKYPTTRDICSKDTTDNGFDIQMIKSHFTDLFTSFDQGIMTKACEQICEMALVMIP